MLDSVHTFGFYVKIGGSFVDLWSRYRKGSLRVEDAEGGEIDTLSIELEDTNNDLALTEWSECYWLADGATRYFGGYLVKVKPVAARGGDTRYWTVRAESYATRLARSTTIRKTYVGQTVKAIVGDLFTESGLTGFDVTTYVDTGPTLESFTAADERLPALLDRLALLAGEQASPQTTWTWQIDPNKNLVLGALGSNPAPFSIATITAADYIASFPPSGDPDVETDASTIFNRITVRGGAQTSAVVTETFNGDGATVLFKVAHLPIRDIVRITVGGTLQSHGTDWYDTFGGGYATLVNYAAGTVRWPDVSPPAVGVGNIVVTYRYDDTTTISATVTDAASYAKYGLYLDAPDVNDRTLTSQQQAEDLGYALLREYANGVVEGTFTVQRLGLRAGQELSIVYPLFGLNGVYAIRHVTTELDPASNGVICTVRFGGRADSLSAAVGGGTGGAGGASGGSGGSAYGQPTQPALNGEADILRVRNRIEMIDQATNWNSEVDPDTATGWVGLYDPTNRMGKWLGYNAGVLQAYLDSDGTIKWANNYLDANGTTLELPTNTTCEPYAKLRWGPDVNKQGSAAQIWGTVANTHNISTLYIQAVSQNTPLWDHATIELQTYYNDETLGPSFTISTQGGLSANNNVITAVGDAVSATDALNLQTANTLYLRQTARVVTVDANGVGDYTTLTAAIAAINAAGDASAVNPYSIRVAPGQYAESVTLPDYVSLIGAGWKATILLGLLTTGSASHVEDIQLAPPDPATVGLVTNQASDSTYFTNVYILINTSVDGTVIAVRNTGSTDVRFYNCFIYGRNPSAGASAKTVLFKSEATGGDVEVQECHLKSSCPHAGGNTLAWNASATANADIIVLASSWSVFNDATPVGADNDNASGQIKLSLHYENDQDDDGLYSTAGSGIIDAVALLANGTVPLTANWDAGGYEIRAQTFQSDVATGTAPLIVASETLVSHLNADLFDGYQATAFPLLAGRAGGQTLIGGADVADILKLQGTSGNGTLTSPAIQALVGNNGATVAWTVLNNGNVGIGTTNPVTKLHIAASTPVTLPAADGGTVATFENAATAGTNSLIQIFSGNTGSGFINFGDTDARNMGQIQYNHSTNQLTLYSSGTTNISNGNVGIGTTSPGSKLTIATGNIALSSNQFIGYSEVQGQAYTPYDSSFYSYLNSTQSIYMNIDSDSNNTDQSFVIAKDRTGSSGGTELLRVLENGNVGIGTTLSAAAYTTYDKLNVYGGGLLFTGASSLYERARGSVTVAAIDNTDATRKYRLVLSAYDSGGAREGIRIDADGTAARLGFYGVDTTVRQSLYDYYSYAESSAYTGAADGEAKLADLNALRTGYEEVRQAVEDLRNILDIVGLAYIL